MWRARIEKANVCPMCRTCGAAEEMVFHLVSECRVMAQNEYEGRHDKVAKIIHWDMYKEKGVEVSSKFLAGVKILWDFNIQTDHIIEHRRPDVVVLDDKANSHHLVDIAVPADSRVDAKEEKIQKYQDLARELRKVWKVKNIVFPVVVGSGKPFLKL